eukprot:CAMPEP_0174255752 /NCGR_PEP_ID=MMETSP0439-20130205/5061_1 /TAXON_ID=0 /ORGANISM="Stereomyxa ramosa, Strain Chinc5" /LENGTH=208 /DNA_ID=CAMNT_0015338075 /DNA_START=458 /DNA_END=1084 /DNA_ORIENTATION=-
MKNLVKFGILQFVVVHLATSATSLFALFLGDFKPVSINEKAPYVYLITVNTISLLFCVFCFSLYAKLLKRIKTLANRRITWKVFTIQCLLLLENLQGLVVALILNSLQETDTIFLHNSEAEAWSNFVLMLELPFIAFMMFFFFPGLDSLNAYRSKHSGHIGPNFFQDKTRVDGVAEPTMSFVWNGSSEMEGVGDKMSSEQESADDLRD